MTPGSCAVIGSGPNGLAAAVRMAQAGCRVTVYEAQGTVGGGCRSAEITLPGFVHDLCSAIHPLGIGSPYFRTLPLGANGLSWVHPASPLAHPLDGGRCAVLHRSIAETAGTLGADGNAYARLVGPLTPDWDTVCPLLLGPLRCVVHPVGLARFAAVAAQSAHSVARRFREPSARALLAGLAAHSFLPLTQAPSAGFGVALAVLGHCVGWPFPSGGSQRIADALVAVLRTYGGQVHTDTPITSLADVGSADVVLADVSAHQLAEIAGGALPAGYVRRALAQKPGPAVFKVDYALDTPVPWSANDCNLAGTVHLGGELEEIAASEAEVAAGRAAQCPFVLAAQQSLFDPLRAPAGKHTLWAYCHVPLGCDVDMSSRIEAQIERFAPGFTSRILARRVTAPADIASHNANCAGGDITGGAYSLLQMVVRPVVAPTPWSTGAPNLFLCSASTPPGGGVHGMCGYYAAQTALGKLLR